MRKAQGAATHPSKNVQLYFKDISWNMQRLAKMIEREKLERMLEEFLAKGGEIKVFPLGYSATQVYPKYRRKKKGKK